MSSARFERLEDKVSELVEKLDYLSHHMEHELAAVSDHNKVRGLGVVVMTAAAVS